MKIMIVKDRNVLNTKFLAEFVNSLAALGHDVHVVCSSYKKQGSGVTLDPRVRFTNLNGKTDNPLLNLGRRLRELVSPCCRYQKIIQTEQPDVIICYFPVDLFNVTFMAKHQIPVIMMMHCYPPAIFGRFDRKPALKRRLYQHCFRQAAAYQVLLKSFIPTLPDWLKNKKIVAIPNQVVQISPEQQTDLNQEKKKIIYVARVEKEGKRQHLIVEAFAKIASDFPDWTVEFWGLEKYRKYNEELMEMARRLNIADNIRIMGYHPQIQEVYRQADIHAFASLREGFGLALADGMAMGLPSVGFAEAPAVNELIVDGHNGYLVKDVDELADRLRRLMQDKQLRCRLGRNAVQDMQAYNPEAVIQMWDKFIHEVVAEHQPSS